jgi:predicted translin family RNA/ssDNA-binding protein
MSSAFIAALEETIAIAEADYRNMLTMEYPRPLGEDLYKKISHEAQIIKDMHYLLIDEKTKLIISDLKKITV